MRREKRTVTIEQKKSFFLIHPSVRDCKLLLLEYAPVHFYVDAAPSVSAGRIIVKYQNGKNGGLPYNRELDR